MQLRAQMHSPKQRLQQPVWFCGLAARSVAARHGRPDAAASIEARAGRGGRPPGGREVVSKRAAATAAASAADGAPNARLGGAAAHALAATDAWWRETRSPTALSRSAASRSRAGAPWPGSTCSQS